MKKIKLHSVSTCAPKSFEKEKTKKKLEHLKKELGELQNRLYAEGKHSLLVVIQGMDAAGKDGAVKNVFDAVNPMGCNVFAYKKPTEPEAKHDFLWRIHKNTPARGMIHIFNRSHYEDVLIQRVHHWVSDKKIHQRYEHINNFEKLLVESETVVLKFYLHISKKEQLERLNERLSDPTKKWKHSDDDIKEREYWNDYMDAYETAFEKCSGISKWHVVPSDQNWYKEYYIAKIIVDELKKLKMKYPGLNHGE